MAEWIAFSGLLGVISLLIVVMLHMIARAFGLQGLTMWVKSEYMQVAVTFLIIAFAGMMDAGGPVSRVMTDVALAVAQTSGNSYLLQAVGSGSNNPSEISKAYLQLILGCEKLLYSAVYHLNLYMEFFHKTGTDQIGVESATGGYALSGFVTLNHFINNNLVNLALFQYLQYSLIDFSADTMLYIFLPIGLALRAFAPTRGAGGFVTAFAIGFAFVFPMTYVVIVAMMPSVPGLCNLAADTVNNDPAFQMLSGQPCFNSVGGAYEAYFKLKITESAVAGFLENVKGLMSTLFLHAMLYPMVALIITFTFIRQTGSLFGADLAEIGRGLIKII